MLSQAFFQWQSAVKERAFTPFLLSKDGHPSDFSYLPITQYASAMEGTAWESFSAMLDTFYETREQQERVRQKGQDLLRTASNARDRLKRKLALQEKEYAQTQQRDHLRICGELITANLYRMEKGQSLLRASNYYEESCPEMDIPLDPLLTPQQNAARYFRQYNKAKAAEVHLSQQMEIARRERDWLESVLMSSVARRQNRISMTFVRNLWQRDMAKNLFQRERKILGAVSPVPALSAQAKVSGFWWAAAIPRTTSLPGRPLNLITGSIPSGSMDPM